MSNDLAKFINSRRRHKNDVSTARQLRIALARLSFPDESKVIKQPHRLTKHHAMDCGNPRCRLCGNPRHIRKGPDGGLTVQERRLFQDVERTNDKHSNGLPKDQNEN